MSAFDPLRTLGGKYRIGVVVADPALKIEVDPTQFETAIVNALVNARDAMPAGGDITLKATSEQADGKSQVRISIKDTGLGMPARVKERAFDPFFTTKEVGKGTGLGLSQIHGFAAQAGGSTEIESQEGRGTTISMVIPQSCKEVDPANERSGTSQLLTSIKILLVEDNDQVRAFAHNMLLDAGCQVIEASNAAEALHKLEGASVDLVLTDVVMPGASGVELANQIRGSMPDLPIVLVSGYSDELVDSGTDFPFLTKPFTSVQLRAVLGSALGQTAVASTNTE